jgi:tetratricopeptide (TPR) repeat protein
MVSYYFFQWPVVGFDADLWNYLNWGRYFFDHKEIPYSSFYSFVSPERECVNYTWLFQILIYSIFKVAGYVGLIFYRTLVSLAIMSVIFCYLQKNQNILTLPFVFAVCFLVLIDRSTDIRPYNLSYLFIIVTLYILEFSPRHIKYLPLISLVWLNIHGVEYPILILIILAYIIEIFARRIKKSASTNGNERKFLVVLVISMGTILLTPNGFKLLTVPFTSTDYASLYIQELSNFSLIQLFSFKVSMLTPSYHTIYNIFFFVAGFIILMNLLKKQIRLSHFIILVGGCIMLTKGLRFINEFVLLSLPAMRTKNLMPLDESKQKPSTILSIILAFFLVAVPYAYMKNLFSNQPKYPFSPINLPHGVSQFLIQTNKTGTVLNSPANGGYLQWMLYPKYKIFMDMHVPFLFTDDDLFVAKNATTNTASLGKFIQIYNPTFITLPRQSYYKNVIRIYTDYVPVFFDDSEILWVNKNQLPDIADKYQFKMIDPFTLGSIQANRLKENSKDRLLNELLTYAEIYPHSRIVNRTIVRLYNEKGLHDKAMQYVQLLIQDFPEMSDGYLLKGDYFLKQKFFLKAIRNYKIALKKDDSSKGYELYKKLWFCYFQLQQHKKAYTALKEVVNPFAPTARYTDLYNLGLSALKIGKAKEALMLLKFANFKVPDDDKKWKTRIKQLLSETKLAASKQNRLPQ